MHEPGCSLSLGRNPPDLPLQVPCLTLGWRLTHSVRDSVPSIQLSNDMADAPVQRRRITGSDARRPPVSSNPPAKDSQHCDVTKTPAFRSGKVRRILISAVSTNPLCSRSEFGSSGLQKLSVSAPGIRIFMYLLRHR